MTIRQPRDYPEAWLRRDFLAGLAALSGSAMIAPFSRQTANAYEKADHFMLHVCVSGGMDTTCLFDARPLEFTDRGKLANYAYKNSGSEPTLPDPRPLIYEAPAGGRTLRSPLTNPLAPYLDQMAICNGVLMGPQNGHGTNMYYLFSNTSAPGESFMPRIGSKVALPMENVHLGGFDGDGNRQPTNFSKSIRMSPDQGFGLGKALVDSRRTPFDDPSMAVVKKQIEAATRGDGKFSTGAKIMAESFARAPVLGNALRVKNQGGEGSGLLIESALNVAYAYYLGGVTRSVTIMLDFDPIIDVHSRDSAKAQLTQYRSIVANLQYLFSFLNETEFRAGKSLMDLTTVMISSEFSRTMRQFGAEIDNTGTDHNPHTNSIIFAGKGIKGGQVIGASDLSSLTADGEFEGVSKAHLSRDPSLLSFMGKPFDMKTGQIVEGLPEAFSQNDYLNMPSLTNTIMDMFGVKQNQWFQLDGSPAPILSQLRQV